ncbi:hypothetical protein DEU56DRAFT_746664, partial [Suillus clintonianus]|uniref:uncharacterized protein n=1 Tax=Suillus clintonianus TaxID=1904413 RepID=UPI001B878CD2
MFDAGNDVITEEDRDNIRAFQLKMLANIPRHAYDRMRYAFRHKMTLDSEWVIVHRLALLSGIEPQNIHCCIQSCIAYTGQYVHDERCPFCDEARYTKHGHPRRTFMYIPLIPRLQALFHNPTMIEQLTYRHNFAQSDRLIRDVFDGEWYRKLRSRHVVVDGVKRRHKYFHEPHDIALALSADSYLLF